PKKTLPAENETRQDRQEEHRAFRISPEFVAAFGQLGAPFLFVGGRGLIQPPKMRPPEAAMLGAGDVFGRVRQRMMMPVIGDPARRSPRAIEHGPEDQEVFDDLIDLESAMGQQAVVADRGPKPAERDEAKRENHDFPARDRKQNDRRDRQRVNQYQVEEHPAFPRSRLPKR